MKINPDVAFRANVDKYLVLSGVKTKVKLAERMRLCQRTLERRLQNPGTFSVYELRRLSIVLGMPIEECSVVIK